MIQYCTEETIDKIREIAVVNGKAIDLIPKGTLFYHSQKEEYEEAFFFQRGLGHRFADTLEQVGLMYFAFDLHTMFLEAFKKRVFRADDIYNKVFYEYRLNQDLLVANIPVYSTCLGARYEQLVEKEDGPNGYSCTQSLSTSIIRAQLPGVGGLIYHSRANPSAGPGSEGRCLALFEGNEDLFDVVDRKPLNDFNLPEGCTVRKLLRSYGKRVV